MSIAPPRKGFYVRTPTPLEFQLNSIHFFKMFCLGEPPPPRNIQSLLWEGGMDIFWNYTILILDIKRPLFPQLRHNASTYIKHPLTLPLLKKIIIKHFGSKELFSDNMVPCSVGFLTTVEPDFSDLQGKQKLV